MRQAHKKMSSTSTAATAPPAPTMTLAAAMLAVSEAGRQASDGAGASDVIACTAQFVSFAKLLVDNVQLLCMLATEDADSIAGLAKKLARDPGNLGEPFGSSRPLGSYASRPARMEPRDQYLPTRRSV